MIYLFSGTGNTASVASRLAEKTGSAIHRFTAEELRNPHKVELTSDDAIIVWAFPTYSWGIPPVVRNIIRYGKLNFGTQAVHIAVTTCGDDIGNLQAMFTREIKRRGLVPGAVFSVMMPNTYVMMKGFDTDSETLVQQKIKESGKTIDSIVESINSNRLKPSDSQVTKGSFPWFKTSVIYPWFTRFDMTPKGFKVSEEKCIHCHKCENACPMNNITFDTNDLPVWGNECAFCTACYHVCPAHAVNWKNATQNKGQKKILSQP